MMERLAGVSEVDIKRWDQILDNDTLTPAAMKDNLILREVFYSGFWLLEQIRKLGGCSEEKMLSIQFTHGTMSYGHYGWKVAEELLTSYKNGTMEFVDEETAEKEMKSVKEFDVPRDEKNQN